MPPPHPPGSSSGSPTAPTVPISITICGDGGAGKSSITLRLVRSAWTSDYDPTIEDSYSVTRKIDGHTYHLSLTDTAGQEEYRGMWAGSNLGADAFLLVYDITNKDSLEALGYFNDMIDMEAETRRDNATRAIKNGFKPGAAANGGRGGGAGGAGAGGGYDGGSGPGTKTVPPIKMVAGNKCDLSEARQVPAAMGLDWARQRGCGFMESSARLQVNIEETFALMVRRVVEGRRLAEQGVFDQDTAQMNKRGMTRPLSPLPVGEKGGDGAARAQPPSGKKGFWRRMFCF